MKLFTIAFLTTMVISVAAYAVTCRDFSTCEEAVKAWCSGAHPRADGDGDGIPCENVCSSRAQVEEIMAKINCNK